MQGFYLPSLVFKVLSGGDCATSHGRLSHSLVNLSVRKFILLSCLLLIPPHYIAHASVTVGLWLLSCSSLHLVHMQSATWPASCRLSGPGPQRASVSLAPLQAKELHRFTPVGEVVCLCVCVRRRYGTAEKNQSVSVWILCHRLLGHIEEGPELPVKRTWFTQLHCNHTNLPVLQRDLLHDELLLNCWRAE